VATKIRIRNFDSDDQQNVSLNRLALFQSVETDDIGSTT
jgi:hypothetical protein